MKSTISNNRLPHTRRDNCFHTDEFHSSDGESSVRRNTVAYDYIKTHHTRLPEMYSSVVRTWRVCMWQAHTRDETARCNVITCWISSEVKKKNKLKHAVFKRTCTLSNDPFRSGVNTIIIYACSSRGNIRSTYEIKVGGTVGFCKQIFYCLAPNLRRRTIRRIRSDPFLIGNVTIFLAILPFRAFRSHRTVAAAGSRIIITSRDRKPTKSAVYTPQRTKNMASSPPSGFAVWASRLACLWIDCGCERKRITISYQ